MKAYTVVWPELIRDQLAEMWLGSVDRNEISLAANLIDNILARNPTGVGSEIGPSLRYADFGVLRVMYELSELDRRVRISAIKLLH